MYQKQFLYGLMVMAVASILVGCANVEPWDRNILAKDHMTTIPDPLGADFLDHLYTSRAGTEGATGSLAGGCGCN
jgi:hypothetical protein